MAFPVYRAYVVPGEPAPWRSRQLVRDAVATAKTQLPEERHDTATLLGELALGDHGRGAHRDEFVVRFQQTCGPVMAKGVEDTAFYRWLRLTALNEVGGDPDRFGVPPAEFHARCAGRVASWPRTLLPASSNGGEKVPRPPLPGAMVTMPPVTPLLPGRPTS